MICCTRRTAPLCWLDQILRCRIPLVCRAHDSAITRTHLIGD